VSACLGRAFLTARAACSPSAKDQCVDATASATLTRDFEADLTTVAAVPEPSRVRVLHDPDVCRGVAVIEVIVRGDKEQSPTDHTSQFSAVYIAERLRAEFAKPASSRAFKSLLSHTVLTGANPVSACFPQVTVVVLARATWLTPGVRALLRTHAATASGRCCCPPTTRANPRWSC
jgi:hypothetical protein